MRDILLGSIFLGLNDLLTTRLPALQSFPAGAASVATLTAQRDAMAGLPTITGINSAVEGLENEDQRHDGFGRAVWHILEAYRVCPATPDDLRAAAKKVQDVLVPSINNFTLSYKAEVAAWQARQEVDLEKELTMFPLAESAGWGAGATLSDWASMFDSSATGVYRSLRDKTEEDTRNRKETTRLRTETIGMLNRLRTNLTLAVKQDAKLPADLDEQVFGYFDQLEKQATEAKAKPKAKP
jgi:hypothetical protein